MFRGLVTKIKSKNHFLIFFYVVGTLFLVWIGFLTEDISSLTLTGRLLKKKSHSRVPQTLKMLRRKTLGNSFQHSGNSVFKMRSRDLWPSPGTEHFRAVAADCVAEVWAGLTCVWLLHCRSRWSWAPVQPEELTCPQWQMRTSSYASRAPSSWQGPPW